MRRSVLAGVLLVLMSPFVFAACGDQEATSPSPSPSPTPPPSDIIGTAQANGEFTTLLRAVRATDLESLLTTPGPYTLFAPRDAAFGDLEAGELQGWFADPQGALVDVVQYHVVPGKIMATDLRDGDMLTTISGKTLEVTVDEAGVVRVSGAKLVTTDLEASNGVIQVLDEVLIPEMTPTPSPLPP